MKRNPKRVWRSVISVVLALTLVLGMAATSFAASTTPVYEVTKDDVAQKIEELYGMVEDYCATDAEAQEMLDKVIEAVGSEEFAEAVAKLEAKLAEEGKTIDTVIDEIIAEMNELNAYLYELKIQIDNDPEAQAKIAEIEGQIEDLKALLDKAYDQRDALMAAAEKAGAAIDKMVEIAVTNSDEDMAPSIEQLKEAIQDVAVALEEVQGIADVLCNAIDEAAAEAAAIIEEVDALIADIKADIEELEAEVKAEIEAIITEIETAIAEIEAAINEAIADVEATIEEIKAIVEETVANIIAEIEAAIDEAIAYVEAKIEAATTCDYEVTEDSYLVGIGDFSTYVYDGDYDSYVAALAKKLGVEYSDYLCAGAASPEWMIEYINEDEDAIAEIKAADLITIGFGNAQIMENAFFSETGYTDWAKYVGAENEKYVDEALAEIEAYMAENGIEGETADILLNLIDGYAYAYTELACGYPELINEVKGINPDAQIIIVGMHNPLTGFVVDVDGTEVPVGEYVDYIIAASNAHYFGYSLITGNAIYVDAPAVETKAAEMTIDELLDAINEEGFTAFNPTAAGHEYIAEQIMGAINVVKPEVAGLWGDADSNGEVNVFDAQLILEWIVKNVSDDEIALNVCDVDASGTVDVFDAQMILERVVGNNTVFPAEK